MEDLRKVLGRRIRRARQRAGYRSQRAFAEAIGVHETSVAYAETGNSRVGGAVFAAIEDGLGWPEDSIARYLDTGDEDLLPSGDATNRDQPVRAPLTPSQLQLLRAYDEAIAAGMSHEDARELIDQEMRRRADRERSRDGRDERHTG